MVEFIVLSDDEVETNYVGSRTPVGEEREASLNRGNAVNQAQKRPCKLVLVDSRQCPHMPRPRFLPIACAPRATSDMVPEHHGPSLAIPNQKTSCKSAVPAKPSQELDDEDEDPNYEDIRPLKRRRTAVKKVPKKHGKLTAPDWEVVKSGGAGLRQPESRPMILAKITPDRKEAREYVKKLTANVDWEEILKQLELLSLTTTESGEAAMDQDKTGRKPVARRGPSPANRLKQYWQNVLMKSVLKMNFDCSK